MAAETADRFSAGGRIVRTAAAQVQIAADSFLATALRRPRASHTGYRGGLHRGAPPEQDTRIRNGRGKNLAQRPAPFRTNRSRTCRDPRNGDLGNGGPCGEDRIRGAPLPRIQAVRIHPAAWHWTHADGRGAPIIQSSGKEVPSE